MTYLIVGGGMAADAAVRGIRSQDPDGRIVLLTEEAHPPYDRPPLSKGLWAGEDESRVWRGTEELGVQIETGRRVVALDRDAQQVRDDLDAEWEYDRLLLATGSRVRRLQGPDPGVIYLRTLDDYRQLRRRLGAAGGNGRTVGLIGGGFIGCELAGVLVEGEIEVRQYFPEEAPLARVLPPEFSRLLAEYLESLGVELHPGQGVTSTEEVEDGWHLRTDDGALSEPVAAVAAGIGANPRTEVARDAGLPVDGGIVVDAGLRTRDPRIFAAGDVARFPSSMTGQLELVAHEEHANESGMLAGQAMTGAEVCYDPLPYFYSGIGGLTLEVLGFPSPEDQVERALPEAITGSGLARFRRQGRTSGVLIWNRPGRAHRIRRLLASREAESDPEFRELLATALD
jgi:3-phenylpropionate/trans-cinnamate dioxygenase ferredoxin reductase component